MHKNTQLRFYFNLKLPGPTPRCSPSIFSSSTNNPFGSSSVPSRQPARQASPWDVKHGRPPLIQNRLTQGVFREMRLQPACELLLPTGCLLTSHRCQIQVFFGEGKHPILLCLALTSFMHVSPRGAAAAAAIPRCIVPITFHMEVPLDARDESRSLSFFLFHVSICHTACVPFSMLFFLKNLQNKLSLCALIIVFGDILNKIIFLEK